MITFFRFEDWRRQYSQVTESWSLIVIDKSITERTDELWCQICVPERCRDSRVGQGGSVSGAVIRSLIQGGSGENRVRLLSDTSMKRDDISSEHVSTSLPPQSARQQHTQYQLTYSHQPHHTVFKLWGHTMMWQNVLALAFFFFILLLCCYISLTHRSGFRTCMKCFVTNYHRKDLREITLSHCKH